MKASTKAMLQPLCRPVCGPHRCCLTLLPKSCARYHTQYQTQYLPSRTDLSPRPLSQIVPTSVAGFVAVDGFCDSSLVHHYRAGFFALWSCPLLLPRHGHPHSRPLWSSMWKERILSEAVGGLLFGVPGNRNQTLPSLALPPSPHKTCTACLPCCLLPTSTTTTRGKHESMLSSLAAKVGGTA